MSVVLKQKRNDLVPQEYVFHIEVEKITPNPNQPRRDFNETAIRDLANSIREFGILQPIVVSKIGKETPDGIEVEYQLIAGERRLLAAKFLGLRVIPAIIRNVDLEREKLEARRYRESPARELESRGNGTRISSGFKKNSV